MPCRRAPTISTDWSLRVSENGREIRRIDGSATGQMNFGGGRKLLLDCGFPGAPGSVEIPLAGMAYSNIVIALSE
jgi:hypothetical protein